jgi:hypothetical protein
MPKGSRPARPERPIYLTINVFLPSEADTNEGDEQIMAKVDDLQTSIDELEAAIREFLTGAGTGVAAIQAELDALRADDAVEDTKLDSMKNAVQNLTQLVKTLRDDAGEALPDGGESLPPVPDQTLPGDQPHPDQTLPGDLPPDAQARRPRQ